jgi:hypothetical protein
VNVDSLLCAAAVIWLPGAAILRLVRVAPFNDRPAKIAAQIAAGLALWPILFLWTSIFSLHWTSFGVRCVVAACAGVALFPRRGPRFVLRITFPAVLLLAVLAVTGRTRLAAIAGLQLPPWVDSVHHTMLVRLFLMKGSVPATYDPFIPGAAAFYHWGFHAIAAAFLWFQGRTEPFAVASGVLGLGQLFNAATPLFVYAAALSMVRSRSAAVVAAALSGLVSYYPAYYVSWGRYTHLTGVLLLLAWIALAMRARRLTAGSVASLAIVAAGLALIHVRLAFFAVTFTIVALFRRKMRPALLAAGAVACILVLPWLVQMRHVAPHAIAPGEGDPRWTSPADVRANLLWVPHAAELLSVATAGLTGIANIGPLSTAMRIASFVWWLAIIVLIARRHRPRALLAAYAILAAWCALTLLILNTTHLQFATNTSAAITAFVPVCIAAGALVAWCVRRYGSAIVVIACCVIGVMTLSNVINPSTVIAGPADVAALHWIHDSLPPSATIIGRVQPWYGGAFIGVDGAYWSSVLTDRRSLPPPSLYGWSGTFSEMELFLARWRDEYPNVTPTTLDEAAKLGVTHVYFKNVRPAYEHVVYDKDGVVIAELDSSVRNNSATAPRTTIALHH